MNFAKNYAKKLNCNYFFMHKTMYKKKPHPPISRAHSPISNTAPATTSHRASAHFTKNSKFLSCCGSIDYKMLQQAGPDFCFACNFST